MADESEGIDIKLSEEDSPAEILRESEDISLFSDNNGDGETSIVADSKIDEDLSVSKINFLSKNFFKLSIGKKKHFKIEIN